MTWVQTCITCRVGCGHSGVTRLSNHGQLESESSWISGAPSSANAVRHVSLRFSRVLHSAGGDSLSIAGTGAQEAQPGSRPRFNNPSRPRGDHALYARGVRLRGRRGGGLLRRVLLWASGGDRAPGPCLRVRLSELLDESTLLTDSRCQGGPIAIPLRPLNQGMELAGWSTSGQGAD